MASATKPAHERGFEAFEQIPDAIIVVDRQGPIRYANDQAGRLFGHEPATLLSTPIEALLPEQLRKRHVGHRTKYSAEPHLRPRGTGFEPVGCRADGTTFPVDVMLNPTTRRDQPLVLLAGPEPTGAHAPPQGLCR